MRIFVFTFATASFAIPNSINDAKDKTEKTNNQQTNITGTVTDAFGNPIPAVNITEKGTTNATITDFDGNYTLTPITANTTIVFSSLGFVSQEININKDQITLNVSLEEDIAQLEELVVVGFGSQKKSKIVSAVAQVTGEELKLDKRAVTNGFSALIGAVPGLVLNNNNGSPGATPSIQTRGTSTIGGSTDMLIIIDNFEGSLSDIDPQNIESVSVLKDASAVAIYGARGANGVLLVTTKQTNRNKKTSITYNGNVSVQARPDLPQTVNSVEYMNFQNNIVPGTWDQTSLDLANSGFYPDTQWAEVMFNNTAAQQSHTLSINGGNENTGYLMSANYLTQEGLSIGEDMFERLNLRLKIDTDVNKWLTVGANALISNRFQKSVDIVGGSNVRGLPFYPVKTEDGLWVSNGTADGSNPVASASSGSFRESDLDRINTQLYAKIKPFKGFSVEQRLSFIKSNQYDRDWDTPFTSYLLDPTNPDSYTDPAQRQELTASIANRELEVRAIKSHELRSLTSLNYEVEKGAHYFKAFLAMQAEQGESELLRAARRNFLLDDIISLNQGTDTEISTGEFGAYTNGNYEVRGSNDTTLSYFGRLNYVYQDKYLVEASFRRDGTSYFLDNNKFAFFPSVALGWVVSKENFMENVDFVNMLKIRSSYGTAGSDGTLGSVTQQLVTFDATGYPLNESESSRILVEEFVNPDLIWETSTIFNAGIDASLFNGKLQFEADYFKNKRSNILGTISSTSYEYGFGNAQGNPYDVESWGTELNITHKNQIGDWRYNVSANISNYDNKITGIQGAEESLGFSVGESVNNRVGYEVDGFFDSEEEINTNFASDGITLIDQNNVTESNTPNGAYLGGFKYKDQLTVDTDDDGVMDASDGVINNDDRVIIDANNDRNLNFGFNFGVSYKNLSLSARFYGSFDNNQYWNSSNVADPFLGGGVPFSYQLDYWSETNKNALLPRPTGLSNETYATNVDYFIVDAEFIKLQNITLNYNFNKKGLDKIPFIKSINMYFSMENVGVVWTNSPIFDHGWDPELGVNNVDYPLPLTSSLGINIKF